MEVENFLEYITSTRKVSQNTVAAYRQDLLSFGRFLKQNGIEHYAMATNTQVVSYLMQLKQSGKSRATVNRKLASIRALYRYLQGKGEISENPTEGIKSPKINRKEISYLSIEEVESLLATPDDSVKGKRDRAMLEVLYATGIRVSEIIELRMSDVNLNMGFVMCSGNHGRARIVPMGGPARSALQTYLDESRPALIRDQEDGPDKPLFVNYMGEQFTRQGFWKILKQYGKAANLEDKLTPQTLRNSFAMHMVQNGIDMKSLQELMGHEDILATQVYFEHMRNRIKDIYDRTHPRA
ncbi:tyrosine recombinase [Hornefia butyriciproducens]|uniref:tyrosine recombinase n=1 Tax=Hornefia butyriciproducens TaxID=2652293 RepID=UPI0023F423CE|nr:tyrosine recombinase [Hornefia butyriciproducens]MDD6298552.1 tyrosine recombinase [Hornefia butyriciproducens]